MNKMKSLLIIASLGLTVNSAIAQTSDPVIMKIQGKPVLKSEFENVYKKNSGKEVNAEKKSVQDYVELFVNFKLKVTEAEEMKLDTSEAFKNELAGYRKQLAAPYLTDKNVSDQLVQDAYERTKTEIRATHILIKCAEDALPKDTLIAYNKISEYRKRALKGEDFANLARETASQNIGDPSAKDNGGDLGYFSALQMVYPFENAAYNTKVGEISMPVRTRFGYHVIKVLNRRPNQGEILVAHIMLRVNKEMKPEDTLKVKQKIEEIYMKLKAGEKFDDLLQFSEDKQSAQKGGQLSWFSYSKMPITEFADVAFSLKKNEDFSEPLRTKFGWHVIKRIDKKEIGDFNSMKVELKQKISKDSRSQMSKTALINKIKKDNGFKENLKAKDELVKMMDTSYFAAQFKASSMAKLNKELISIGTKKLTQQDFAKYLESRQTRRVKSDLKIVLEQQYKGFVDETCLNFEDAKLEEKYPEFKNLLQEYRDGILLFDLTDKKVWSKAVRDTTGLKEYYEANKNAYLWEERAETTTYKCANEKAFKQVKKMLDAGKTDKEISDAINKNSQLNVTIESVTYLKGENKTFDEIWKTGEILTEESMSAKKELIGIVYKVNKILPKSPKKLNEARGLVTADYQNYLEKEWLKSLKTKYTVEVMNDVVKTVN